MIYDDLELGNWEMWKCGNVEITGLPDLADGSDRVRRIPIRRFCMMYDDLECGNVEMWKCGNYGTPGFNRW